MLDEVEQAPTGDFTLRDRIVLVTKDEVKFYTHVSFMCAVSPVLTRFFHGWEWEWSVTTLNCPSVHDDKIVRPCHDDKSVLSPTRRFKLSLFAESIKIHSRANLQTYKLTNLTT